MTAYGAEAASVTVFWWPWVQYQEANIALCYVPQTNTCAHGTHSNLHLSAVTRTSSGRTKHQLYKAC